jgi:PAS domain S-box-containing protein
MFSVKNIDIRNVIVAILPSIIFLFIHNYFEDFLGTRVWLWYFPLFFYAAYKGGVYCSSALAIFIGVFNWYHYIPAKHELSKAPADNLAAIVFVICGIAIGVFFDRQKKLQASLIKSEQMLRSVYDVIPIGLTVTDRDGNIIDCNKASETILGITKEEHFAKKYDCDTWSIIRPDGSEMPSDEYASVIALRNNAAVTDVQMGVKKPNGDISWLSVNAMPMEHEQYGVVVAYVDITKKIDAIREVNERQAMLENLAEGVYAVDRTGACTYINNAALDALGLRRADIIGKVPHNVFHHKHIDGSDYPHHECPVSNVMQHATACSGEDWFFRKDGSGFAVDTTCAPIVENGQVVGAVMTFQDITERKKTEGELEELNSQLASKVQGELIKNRSKDMLLIKQSRLSAMGEMVSNIAHQWRQPLNALAVTVQDAKMAYQYNEMNKEYVDTMVHDSMRLIQQMSHTIDDFRNFFKPSGAKESFGVSDMLNKAVGIMSAGLVGHDISVQVDTVGELSIFGHKNEFGQIVINLIGNAKDVLIDRKTAAAKITITATQEGDMVVVAVCDNGGGIDEEIMDKIFDPYFTTKHQSQGTGLGLYMSKMIIEQNMGGNITAENADDGAIVTIRLPKGLC